MSYPILSYPIYTNFNIIISSCIISLLPHFCIVFSLLRFLIVPTCKQPPPNAAATSAGAGNASAAAAGGPPSHHNHPSTSGNSIDLSLEHYL